MEIGEQGTNDDRYGYHMPRTNARDRFYEKIEQERAANA